MMKLRNLMLCGVPIVMSALMAFVQAQDETNQKPSRNPPGRQAKSKPGQRPVGGLGGGMTFQRIAERHDSNKDSKITKEEFKGPAEFFERMDVDGDGILTKQEFDSRSGRKPGAEPVGRPDGLETGAAEVEATSLLKLLDVDQDNKVSKDELEKFFRRADSDEDGSVSADEFHKWLARKESDPAAETSRDDLQAILKGREGRLKPGDAAPDFKLKRLEGGGEVQLAQVIGKRPVVLIFGSYT